MITTRTTLIAASFPLLFAAFSAPMVFAAPPAPVVKPLPAPRMPSLPPAPNQLAAETNNPQVNAALAEYDRCEAAANCNPDPHPHSRAQMECEIKHSDCGRNVATALRALGVAPKVTSISSTQLVAGGRVTIKGQGLKIGRRAVTVRFSRSDADKPLDAYAFPSSDNLVEVTVPGYATGGLVVITMAGQITSVPNAPYLSVEVSRPPIDPHPALVFVPKGVERGCWFKIQLRAPPGTRCDFLTKGLSSRKIISNNPECRIRTLTRTPLGRVDAEIRLQQDAGGVLYETKLPFEVDFVDKQNTPTVRDSARLTFDAQGTVTIPLTGPWSPYCHGEDGQKAMYYANYHQANQPETGDVLENIQNQRPRPSALVCFWSTPVHDQISCRVDKSKVPNQHPGLIAQGARPTRATAIDIRLVDAQDLETHFHDHRLIGEVRVSIP